MISFKNLDLNYGVTLFIALVIVLDFILPGVEFTKKVEEVKGKRQQYYNAAKNSHYSYKVVTNKHVFSVAEDFANSFKSQQVNYTVSRIFNEVNRYGWEMSDHRMVHNFRLTSGFIFPLICLLIIGFHLSLKKINTRLIYVLQIILLFDVILLVQ